MKRLTHSEQSTLTCPLVLLPVMPLLFLFFHIIFMGLWVSGINVIGIHPMQIMHNPLIDSTPHLSRYPRGVVLGGGGVS